MTVFFLVLHKCCFMYATSELGFVLYGISAFVMWMRTLHFVLVQQELGQVQLQNLN